MYTTNCIICLVPAKVWTGHLLMPTKEAQPITAGWCKEHLHKSEDMSLMKGAACFGEWKPAFGKQSDFATHINCTDV